MKIGRTTMWRKRGTYGWVAVLVTVLAWLLAAMARGTLDAGLAISAAVVVLCCVGGLAYLRQETLTVHGTDLRKLVAETLGHELNNPLTRTAAVGMLRGGQGGWADAYTLGVYGDKLYIDKDILLTREPKQDNPVLVVCDDQQGLHVFRFGITAQSTPLVEYIPDRMSAQVIDHGVVGPARFALAA